jgi:hypothetical protein
VSFILPSQLSTPNIALSKPSAKMADRTAKENASFARGIQSELNFYFQLLTEEMFAAEEPMVEIVS